MLLSSQLEIRQYRRTGFNETYFLNGFIDFDEIPLFRKLIPLCVEQCRKTVRTSSQISRDVEILLLTKKNKSPEYFKEVYCLNACMNFNGASYFRKPIRFSIQRGEEKVQTPI